MSFLYSFSISKRYLRIASLMNSARERNPFFRDFMISSISRISSSGIGTLAYPSGYSFLVMHVSYKKHFSEIFLLYGCNNIYI